MKRLQEKVRKTILFVTHDIDEAVLLADRIALLRGGVLQQFSAPELMWREPANEFVRSFFGENLGLRIMARHCLSSVQARSAAAGSGDATRCRSVDASSTLKEALAELVGSRAERVVGSRRRAPAGDLRVRLTSCGRWARGATLGGACADDGADSTGAEA